MKLLLNLLLLALWSTVGRSDPICEPGSVSGNLGAIETYDPSEVGTGATLITNCTQLTGPIIQVMVEPPLQKIIAWHNTSRERVSIGYVCAENVSFNYTTVLPRVHPWTTRPYHSYHSLASGDECTFFGCYWYVYEGEWVIEDGRALRTPDRVIAAPLMSSMCTIDTNECVDGTAQCAHFCTDVIGGYNCSCRNGYKLEPDGHNCTDIDECSTGSHNCNHICANNTEGGFVCSCLEGYSLSSDGHTCDDIDECEQNMTLCHHLCTNTVGSYECKCREGFSFSSDGFTCEDIDECASNLALCQHNCTNTVGNYTCSCQKGYELLGKHNCKDIDECKLSSFRCDHYCLNTNGSYDCTCLEGYALSEDGHTCEVMNVGISHLQWALPLLLVIILLLLVFCAYMLWKEYQKHKYRTPPRSLSVARKELI